MDKVQQDSKLVNLRVSPETRDILKKYVSQRGMTLKGFITSIATQIEQGKFNG